jgi:hypothetical protein
MQQTMRLTALLTAYYTYGGYMSKTVKQQILISGVGGQGVLFVTGLLAEAAIRIAGIHIRNPRYGPTRGNGGVPF